MTQIKDNTRPLQNEIQEIRGYKVVKHNDLVQKARFQLSLQEQKVILFMISKLKPETIDFTYQDFSIIEFCKICGIDYNNGKNYKNVKDTIKALADKSAWLKLDKDTETLVRWINKVTISKKSGLIKLRLDDDMKPFLLQLQQNFTSYELLYTLAMRSQYSVRLYELFKSYEWRRRCKFDMEGLKKILFAEQYKRFPDFKRYVLDIAMREINDLTDIAVEYEIIKVGRKYGGIEFSIRTKKDLQERMKAWSNIEEVLDPPRISLFSNIEDKMEGGNK